MRGSPYIHPHKFEIVSEKRTKRTVWQWRLTANNGTVICTSREFATKAGAESNAWSVMWGLEDNLCKQEDAA